MADEAERIEDEVTARSIEWWLDRRSDQRAFAEDEFITPAGAGRAIEFMESRYDWLEPYARAVSKAAKAEAAFEAARDAGASEPVVEILESEADDARKNVRDILVPDSVSGADDIVRAYGKLHHVAASQPPEVRLKPPRRSEQGGE